MNQDRLFQLMLQRLQREDLPKETQDEFIKETIALYMEELMVVGFIPYHLMSALEEDLKEELLEMFRKKTYGSINLMDFKNRFKEKRKIRRAVR